MTDADEFSPSERAVAEAFLRHATECGTCRRAADAYTQLVSSIAFGPDVGVSAEDTNVCAARLFAEERRFRLRLCDRGRQLRCRSVAEAGVALTPVAFARRALRAARRAAKGKR